MGRVTSVSGGQVLPAPGAGMTPYLWVANPRGEVGKYSFKKFTLTEWERIQRLQRSGRGIEGYLVMLQPSTGHVYLKE